MPLKPSSACRERHAFAPFPLRATYWCSSRDYYNPRLVSLKPPIEDWVAGGQLAATRADLLKITPAAARRLFAGFPTVVVTELVTDLTPAIDAVVADGGPMPRIIVLFESKIGSFSSEQLERCNQLGVIVIYPNQVERIASRLPQL